MNERNHPRNYLRRLLGVILNLSPLWVLVASAILHDRIYSAAAMWFLAPAACFALVNGYLSFVRPRLYQFRHGSLDGYQFVSVFPMIGTLLVLIGGLVGFGALSAALLGIVVFVVDTGGSLWFLLATWRDESFWDA